MPTRYTTSKKLSLFREAFLGRHDIHGTRDRPSGRGRCVKSPPEACTFLDHLRGHRPLGVYPLVVDRAWFAAIDLDQPDEEPVFALHRLAADLGLPPLIERSKSKGWHLWWFADDAGWPSAMLRRLLGWMTDEVNLPGVEVFPKQDRLEAGGFGNFIYLPLDGHLVPEGRTVFVQPAPGLPPLANPWDALSSRPRCSEVQLESVSESLGLNAEKPNPVTLNAHTLASQKGEHGHNGGASSDRSPKTHGPGAPSDRPFGNRWPLPPCARRILAEGVRENQRVVCFRLAVHLHRVGLPEDLARSVLFSWAAKNRPADGKRVITREEIVQQTRDGYGGRYRGYGCEDPIISGYCGDRCPIRQTQHAPRTA